MPMNSLEREYSYLPCQSCVGKNHCAQCGEEIRRSLLGTAGVLDIRVDALARRLTLVLEDGVDPDDVADAADALGVFF